MRNRNGKITKTASKPIFRNSKRPLRGNLCWAPSLASRTFTLTSFLINIGMPPENVIELFKSFSDYSERMTRYQVEHIAGEKGSRTRYTPPKCDTLQTHGVCITPDEICQRIRHPLNYYRRKIRRL